MEHRDHRCIMHDMGKEVEPIIYVVISASRNYQGAAEHSIPKSQGAWLVGLEAGAIAANGSHMMDKRARSRASYYTAGSGHVLELENDGSTVSLWCGPSDRLRTPCWWIRWALGLINYRGGADGKRLARDISPSGIFRRY